MLELTRKIKMALLAILEDKITAMSWGISDISVTEKQISFTVNGFKFTGRIEITVSDLYYIKIGEKTIICELSDLVSMIDKEVEKDKDYITKLSSLI